MPADGADRLAPDRPGRADVVAVVVVGAAGGIGEIPGHHLGGDLQGLAELPARPPACIPGHNDGPVSSQAPSRGWTCRKTVLNYPIGAI